MMPITYDCPAELEHGDRVLFRIGYNKLLGMAYNTAPIYEADVSYHYPIVAMFMKHDDFQYFINYRFITEADAEGYIHFVELPDYYFLTETDRSKWNDWMHEDGLAPRYNTSLVQVLTPTMEDRSVDWQPMVKFEWALISL
jgi:hypothetical protein